ncbi:M23 family metallopeptidase [Arcanobacterium haemolyticum]|nr:M23 family metallopeptidase [Arcanobacterium haemolyticum]
MSEHAPERAHRSAHHTTQAPNTTPRPQGRRVARLRAEREVSQQLAHTNAHELTPQARPRRRDLIQREQEERARHGSHHAATTSPTISIEPGRISRRKQARAEAAERTTILEYSELAGAVAEGLKASRSDHRRPALTHKPRIHRATAANSWKKRYRTALVAAAGATALAIPLSTLGANLLHAQAAQPLTASIVGGKAAASEAPAVPQALTGSSTAAIKSTTHSAQEEASVNPVSSTCSIDSAQGVRAAFVKQDSDMLVYPISTASYRLSSHFGYRSDPISGGTSFHAGEDFAAALNTPIYAIADGVVVHAGEGIEGRSNNLIIVEHTIEGHTYQSWYIHMYDDGVLVKAGDKVKAGQQIGKVGSNGNSTGPHLHLEIHDPALKDQANPEAELLDPISFLTEHSAQDISSLCK